MIIYWWRRPLRPSSDDPHFLIHLRAVVTAPSLDLRGHNSLFDTDRLKWSIGYCDVNNPARMMPYRRTGMCVWGDVIALASLN